MSTTLDTPALPIPRTRPAWVAPAAYVLMILVAVGVFLLVRSVGEWVVAPEVSAGAVVVAAPGAGRVDVVMHVLTTLAAVIGLGFALGRAFRYLGQPPVIGEVVAGILLGPSLLGAISPEAMHLLIPSKEADPGGQVLAALRAVAQLGVVLYLFLVGLSLDGARFRGRVGATVGIAHAGIAAQFALAVGLAAWLYPGLAPPGVGFTGFALFLGVALSVTGFTVLARILADTGLDRTEAGAVGLGCAAADDVTAWCLLAVVVGVAKGAVGAAAAATAGAAAFVLVMFVGVRPLVGWACRRVEAAAPEGPRFLIPVVLVAVLICALAAEAAGVHAVVGAFLLGAVVPHDSRVAREVTAKLKDVVTVLLLPAFFALTGLRTEIGLLSGWQNWLICLGIIAVATLGKFGGTLAAARFSGHPWRTAAALGAMMNTRGLMGLIVLDIGLGMGVISPTLFAMMVVMALVTTVATAPALRRLLPS